MTHFVTKAMPINGKSHKTELKSSRNYPTNYIKSKSHHQLFVTSQTYTHIYDRMKVISRNQTRADLWPVHSWLKTPINTINDHLHHAPALFPTHHICNLHFNAQFTLQTVFRIYTVYLHSILSVSWFTIQTTCKLYCESFIILLNLYGFSTKFHHLSSYMVHL